MRLVERNFPCSFGIQDIFVPRIMCSSKIPGELEVCLSFFEVAEKLV